MGKPKTDFFIRLDGTTWTIKANSKAAKLFAKEHLAIESWMGTPESFSADWRPARDLCEQLLADGYTVRRV